jgi:hypothetical protein
MSLDRSSSTPSWNMLIRLFDHILRTICSLINFAMSLTDGIGLSLIISNIICILRGSLFCRDCLTHMTRTTFLDFLSCCKTIADVHLYLPTKWSNWLSCRLSHRQWWEDRNMNRFAARHSELSNPTHTFGWNSTYNWWVLADWKGPNPESQKNLITNLSSRSSINVHQRLDVNHETDDRLFCRSMWLAPITQCSGEWSVSSLPRKARIFSIGIGAAEMSRGVGDLWTLCIWQDDDFFRQLDVGDADYGNSAFCQHRWLICLDLIWGVSDAQRRPETCAPWYVSEMYARTGIDELSRPALMRHQANATRQSIAIVRSARNSTRQRITSTPVK